jgi:hypothetical protein
MAAPKHTTVSPVARPRSYESPNHVPSGWVADRPGEITGRQPTGERLGFQGPDQGYALTLMRLVRDDIRVQHGELVEDAIRGTVAIALRRASRYGRAPVMHDIRFALSLWGWTLEQPPAELVIRRRELFAGCGNVLHGYDEARDIADMVPETTLSMTPERVASSMPASWRALTGA